MTINIASMRLTDAHVAGRWPATAVTPDSTPFFAFAPDPARAAQLDRRMQRQLADSLEYIAAQCLGKIPFDQPALARLIARARAGQPCTPVTFACYYRLVEAIMGNELEPAVAWFERLTAQPPAGIDMNMRPLAESSNCPDSALFQQLMTGDASIDIAVLPPTAEKSAAFEQRLNAGMTLMRQALPALAGEISHLVRDLIHVASDPSRKMQFDGGSHYQLWGALFLNADYHPTPEAIVEVLAHESAHSLLFGFCIDETLVLNPDDELYSSPLRQDPRPMDGIYHATFVSARMHHAMSGLLSSGLLTDEARERVVKARDADAVNFHAGHDIVVQHGRLSAAGTALMQGARDYMLQQY